MHKNLIRKIPKALNGLAGGLQLSSSPLTSLNPNYSTLQYPNYNNAFMYNFNSGTVNGYNFSSGLNNSFDNVKSNMLLLATNKMNNDQNSWNLKFGTKLATSNNLDLAKLGLDMREDAINNQASLTSNQTDNQTDNLDFDWDSAFTAASKIGQEIGGTAGNIIGLGSKIGKGIKTITETTGKAKSGNIAAVAGTVADLVGSFLPQKTEYSGDKGDITQTIDATYDGISDAAMAFGPVGMLVGGAMKGASLLGKGANALGGGTDGMTGADAVLGSSLFSWNIGLVNGFGGKRADTITKDEDIFANVGSSYLGTNSAVDNAVRKSGKKYGWISNPARKLANAEIAEATRQLNLLADISTEASNRRAIRDSMAAINGNQYAFLLQGGYDLSNVLFGKKGMIILNPLKSRLILSTPKYQEGGEIEDPAFTYYLNSLPEYQRNSLDFRVKDYWSFNGKPKDFNEAISKGMFTKEKDGWYARSVAENPETGEIEFMKAWNHPTLYKELDWYNSDDGAKFRKEWELLKTQPYYKYVRRKNTDNPQSYKLGGSLEFGLIELDIEDIPDEFRNYIIDEIDIDEIAELDIEDILPEFRAGGKFNVIPEGALHARLNHMEVDNITRKGIPVVSDAEGGKVEQQAEIERSEIIFRLDVTKKLEELAKDGSDEAAIEAGKLLTHEILYNTIDNTNSLI